MYGKETLKILGSANIGAGADMNKNESINFMGDLVLGDQPVIYGFGFDSIWGSREYSDIFSGVSGCTLSVKYNVANFEAVIKKRENGMSVSEWSMCCDESICAELKKANINIVSVANNHTMDYGREWFDYTVDCLTNSGLEVIGLKDRPYTKIKIDDKMVAVISASYIKVKVNKNIGYFYNPTQEEWERVFAECDNCDIKIAYIHWGNEFVNTPTQTQEDIAKMLINYGVDVIIGHHPHILQQNQLVFGIPVVYSLGNFISDYWQKRLRKTAIVNLCASKQLVQYNCMIDKFGCPQLLDNNNYNLDFSSKTESESVFLNRTRMRVEYLIKILCNFYRIKEKRKFIKWLYKRFTYIIKYFFSEIKNPDIVYEHYEN